MAVAGGRDAWFIPHWERLGVGWMDQVTCLFSRAGFTKCDIWKITAWAWELGWVKKEMPGRLTGAARAPSHPPASQGVHKWGSALSCEPTQAVPSKFLLWCWQLPFCVGSQRLTQNPSLGTQHWFQKTQRWVRTLGILSLWLSWFLPRMLAAWLVAQEQDTKVHSQF